MIRTDDFKIKVERELHKGRSLSTIVEILQRAQRLITSENSSIHELANIVASDAVLTANVLKMVNSAFFGVERKIHSIEEAVVLLGISHLRDLFSGIMLSSAIKEYSHETFDMSALWRHSLGTAVAADYMKASGICHTNTDMHMAGLLCNIGRLVLSQRFPEEFDQIIALSRSDHIRMIDAEIRVLGVSHAEVGFWAAEYWNFDAAIAHLIKWHHGPSTSREIDCLNLAYVVTHAKLIGNPGDHMLTRMIPGVLKRLELDEFKLSDLLKKLTDSYAALQWIFRYVPGNESEI
ncbi:MAG: hypothetical protein A2283_00370 [Lentisphaerae bacterium RIFOXYA12_FULL_48_11]|nr:MAG: hypothetical protein A2283_00370 [Lentisphaerae bacterium RIFOXYA12_FULL_48_11]